MSTLLPRSLILESQALDAEARVDNDLNDLTTSIGETFRQATMPPAPEPMFAPVDDSIMEQPVQGPPPMDVPEFRLPDDDTFFGTRAPSPKPSPQAAPSQYGAAVTTLGGTPESEALTRPGGTAYTGAANPVAGGPLEAMSGGYDPSNATRHQKLVRIGQVARAAGLDDEGARILQAVATTEGGLEGAIGDNGQSRGAYQFYEGGQMPGFRNWLRQQGIQGDPNQLVHNVDLATQYAATTYLGAAIARGRAKGLSGSSLATYVQETGQVSVDPWKTGENYRALFGSGQDPFMAQAQPSQPEARAAGMIKGGTLEQAMAADREMLGREGLAYRGDVEPGDFGIPNPQAEGPAVPYGVADNVEPGDFSIPGQELTPARTALLPQAPEAGVEPAASPADVAPPASGNPITDLFSEFGRRLSEVLTPPSQTTSLAQAGQDIRQRQGTTDDPGGPMPFEQVDQAFEPIRQGIAGLQADNDAQMARYNELMGRQLGITEGGPLSPEEEQELASTAIRIVGDVSGLTSAGRGVPGVIGAAKNAANAAGNAAPASGITSRVQADDAAQRRLAELLQRQDDAEAGLAPILSRQELAEVRSLQHVEPSAQTLSMDDVQRLVAAHPETKRVEQAVRSGDFEFTNAPSWREDTPQLYVRYAVNDPMFDVLSKDHSSGQGLRGLSAEPLIPEAYFPTNGKTVADYVHMQIGSYRFLEAQGLDGTRPWIVEGVKTGTGPDGEALVRPIRTLGALDDAGQLSRNIGESDRVSVVRRETPESLAEPVLRTAGTGAGAAYQESRQEGATPESIIRAGTEGLVTGAGNEMLRRSMGAGNAARVSRAVQNQPWQSPYDGQQAPGPVQRTEGLAPIERARRAFVRAWTDDRVDLAEVQREAAAVIGRPLEANEMVTELSRRNPLAAAEAAVKSGPFRDAVQSVGRDVDTLDEVLTYRDMIDVAAATNNPGRRFSGGLTVQDAQQRLAWYADPANVDPQRWATIETAANNIRGWVDEYRQRMLDSGVWSQELYDTLRRQYPNYVPTRIMDYMQDPNNIAVGKSLSLRDRGLRRLTEEGTERERERPLASLIRYAVEAENVIAKNQTYNAFVNLSNEAPDVIPLRPVPANYTRERGEALITGFENGVRTTYATTAPIAAAVQMEASKQIPFLSQATALFRELITRSPVFVAGQVPLDAFSYLIRETARESGNAPRVAVELARAYRDSFAGLGTGRVTGDLYRAIREGGGMAGIHDRTARAMATTLDDVTRRNMVEIRSAADVGRLLKWVASFEWSQAVGQRVEMAPRLAAARLGEARALRQGANADTAALRGVMDFRDVTLDFRRGGTWARTINQAVPFFNVGWQSAATVQRAWRENPRAFPLTALALIGAPAAAAEAWNRSDPQRERDYDDVPDYVKDRGIVIMLPGAESTDSQGNRRPQYALIPLRELAPFAIVARETTAKAMGEDTRGFAALLGAATSAASPIQANNPADFFNTFTPFGASTGLQLGVNRDAFRNRDIATDRNDQEASALAEVVSGVARNIPIADRLLGRPSQAEFAIRDLGGYAGSSALAASDMATGRQRPQSGGPQDTPVVGGLVKRFVGNSIGQGLQDARDGMLSEPVRQALRDAGMRDDELSGVSGTVRGVQLTREEQTMAQEMMNDYLEREIAATLRSPEYRNPRADREALIRDAASRARQLATKRVMDRMPPTRKAS